MEFKTKIEELKYYAESAKRIIRVGENVTDIFWLPCVNNAWKHTDKNGNDVVWYILSAEKVVDPTKCRIRLIAKVGDWMAETDLGWLVLSNEEYEEVMK